MINEVQKRLADEAIQLIHPDKGTISMVPYLLVQDELTLVKQYIDTLEEQLSRFRQLLYHKKINP